jgi:hypothetical protein
MVKIGAKVFSHGRYIAFQIAEVAIPRDAFAELLQDYRATLAAGSYADGERHFSHRSMNNS